MFELSGVRVVGSLMYALLELTLKFALQKSIKDFLFLPHKRESDQNDDYFKKFFEMEVIFKNFKIVYVYKCTKHFYTLLASVDYNNSIHEYGYSSTGTADADSAHIYCSP